MQAIELNNAAASFIENQQYDDAITSLTKAIRIIQELMDNRSWSEQDTTDHPMQQDSPDIEASVDTCHHQTIQQDRTGEKIQTSPQPHSRASFLDNEDNGQTFIYRKPFRIEEQDCIDWDSATIQILFNLALSFHLNAIETSCVKHFRKALSSYETVYEHQIATGSLLSVPQTLGLVNNCGQIHKKVGKPRKANALFQHLLTTLVLLVESGDVDDVKELEGFFGSTSYLILRNPYVARSA